MWKSFFGNRRRHDLPRLDNANELAPMQRDNQLPHTLQLPSPELQAQFGTLAVHLQASNMQMLPKPPLALTIRQIKEGVYQIQLHNSSGRCFNHRHGRVLHETREILKPFLQPAQV